MNSILENLQKNWPYYLVFIVLFIGLLIMIISMIVAGKSNEAYRKNLRDQSNSVRIHVLDLPNSRCVTFSLANLAAKENKSLSDFYKAFPISDQKRVINWINALADPGTEAPDYLETDMQDSKTRRPYFSMLQVDSVDREKGIIHLQSYQLKYMAASRGSSSHSTHGLATMKDFSSGISSSSKRRGATIVFRLGYKKITDKDKEIDPFIFNQTKNVLSPLAYGKGYLLQCSGNELLLSDLHITEKAKALYLARSGLNAINRYLSLNGFSTKIEVRAGVVENHLFPGDADKIAESARRAAQMAFEEKQPVLFYEKGKESMSNFNESAYRTEVERIINDKRLTYQFRPIYSVDEKKVLGYFTKAIPSDTYFESIDELKDYATRTQDDRELFSTIARNTVPIFVNESGGEKKVLFFPVRISERGYMLTVFSHIAKAKEARIVFLFKQSDIHAHFDAARSDYLIEDLRSIKAKGYEVALLLNGGELTLQSPIYDSFDYFVCGFSFAGSASEMDTKIRSQLHALVEKLLKYKKMIIATDIEGWPAIELIVRSGVRYISSESFAKYEPMIQPIPSKSIKRIGDF